MKKLENEEQLIGDTEACLLHFSETHRDVAAFELLAEFCGRELKTVLDWRSQFIVSGEALLKLRCFLELAGYEVREHRRKKDRFKDLAMIVGTGIVTPLEANQALGYSPSKGQPQGLFRLIVHVEEPVMPTVTPDKDPIVAAFLAEHKPKLTANWPITDQWPDGYESGAFGYWQDRIAQVIGSPQKGSVAVTPQPAALDPAVVASGARMITALTALAEVIHAQGGGRLVREMGRHGLDLEELIDVLNRLKAQQ